MTRHQQNICIFFTFRLLNFFKFLLKFSYNPFFSPFYSIVSILNFVFDESLTYFDLNSTHFNNVVFLKQIIKFSLGGNYVLVSDYVVHSFFHFNWIQSWFSGFKILFVDILASIARLNSFDEESVSVFINVEKLLMIFVVFYLNISANVIKDNLRIMTNYNFWTFCEIAGLIDLSHIVIKETVGVLLPLDAFHH